MDGPKAVHFRSLLGLFRPIKDANTARTAITADGAARKGELHKINRRHFFQFIGEE